MSLCSDYLRATKASKNQVKPRAPWRPEDRGTSSEDGDVVDDASMMSMATDPSQKDRRSIADETERVEPS